MRILVLFLVLASLASLPAQSLVIPAGKSLDVTEGNSNSLTPGNPYVARIQCIYDQALMGGAPKLIMGCKIRPDGLYTNYRPWPAFTALNFQVWLDNHPGPTRMDRHSHQANRSSNHTQVVNPRNLNFPLTPLPATAPDLFLLDISFDRPFMYTNTSGMLVEIARDDQAAAYYRWYMDAHNDSAGTTAPEGSFTSYGTGCPGSLTVSCHKVAVNGNLKLPEAPFPGQTFITEGSCGVAAIPVMGALGYSDTNWGGLPLPLSLAPLGAPGCSVYCNWLLTVNGTTDGNGDFKIRWGRIPFDPALAGATFHHQAVAIHSSFSPIGLGLSQGLKIVLGPGYTPSMEVGCVYGNYYGAFPNYSLTDDVPQFWKPKALIIQLY